MSGTQILWKKDRATNLTVRLVQGVSTIPFLNLHPGSSVGPLRVGSAADWCVTGEGVQPIHLSLLFDGTDLFVSAASPTVYVSVNGQPLNAGQWVPVGISSEICFGSAVLHVARGESQPPVGVPQVASAETGPEATLSDGGRLREMAQRARDASGDNLSSAPPPAVLPSAPPPAGWPTPVPAAGQAPPAPPARPDAASAPAPATPKKAGSGSSWSETSLVKKLTLFLLPLAAVGTWLTWDDPEPAPKPKRKKPVASASAPARHNEDSLAKAARATGSTLPREQAPAGESAAPPKGSAAPPLAGSAPSKLPDAQAKAPAPSASAGVLMLAPGSSDTTPRAAIDAAFAGRLESAKELYAKLAAAYPDKPEFALAKKRVEENAVRKP